MNERGDLISLLLLAVLVVLLGVGGYLLYQNVPGEAQRLSVDFLPQREVPAPTLPVRQFFPNMKFNHNTLSYTIESACPVEKRNRMEEAFRMLGEEVESIQFVKVSRDPDIEVHCTDRSKHVNEHYFVAGEGGAKQVVQTGLYNVITNGTILLLENPSKFTKTCDWPNVELHELLHVFGFDHSDDKNSLMYPYLTSCNQQLDESIVGELRRLYAQDNLADLVFNEVSVVQKGRYLDYSVTVHNQGVVHASGVVLEVREGDEVIDTRDLEELRYGAGITLEVQNLRMPSRNVEQISFVLDPKDRITEFDESNNIAIAHVGT